MKRVRSRTKEKKNPNRKSQKGLSTIVATLLIILLTLVAVGIIWVVVRNVINSGSEQISLGKFTLNLKIAQVQSIDDSNVNVTIKRNSGPGDFIGLAFIVEDDKGTKTIKRNVSLTELQQQRFQLNFSSGFNASRIKKISIAPIFLLKSGKESIGDVKDVYIKNVDGTNLVPPATCVPACVLPQVCSGTTCVDETTCTDSCTSLNYQCGTHIICGLSTNCQDTCTTEQTCTGGICTRVPTCGDGILDLGEVCDDGNKNNNDGCLSTCVVEQGYSCTSTNHSICTACAINNIYWLPNSGIQNGNSVLLDVSVNSACNGKSFTFDIRKKNLIVDSTVATINSVFGSSTDAASNWVVNILASGEGNYYLRATLDEKTSVSRDSSNVAITIPTSAQCGLYGCQTSIGENCLTCPTDCGCSSPNVCNSSGICEIPCDLTNAHWNTTTAISGDTVSLIVSGSNCNGKLITFEIRKANPLTTDYVANPSSKTLLSGSATTSWTSVAPFLGDTTPTYYFIASVSGSSETIDSRSTSTSLDVSIISCGDGRCNGAETCSTCSSDCGGCCGNNVINSPEQCDGSQLGGATCTSVRGAQWTGTLSCTAGCLFNTGSCTCAAETNTSFCTRLGKTCGSVTANDNCGISRTVSNCGTCTSPQTCNATNMCTCVTETNTSFCTRLGKNCGNVIGNDNCGISRTINCGTCTGSTPTCTNNVCVSSTPTCSDGIQNQGETGIDCGGPCSACPIPGTYIRTFYVNATTGSDSNTGTSPSSPWKTIAKVNSQTFRAGDGILFERGGTWRELLTVSASGNTTHYITFGNYGSASNSNPRILGSVQATGWTETSTGSHIWKSSTSVSNPYSIEQFGAEIFFENTDGTKSWGTHMTSTSLTAEYQWTWSGNYIYVYSTTNPSTKYTSVEVPQRSFIFDLHYKNYVHIDGINMLYCGYAAVQFDSGDGTWTSQRGLIIENLEIGYVSTKGSEAGYGTQAAYSDMIVRNCEVHDCGRRALSFHVYGGGFTVDNMLIEGNKFYNGFHTTGPDLQPYSTSSFNNWTIRNNIFDDSKSDSSYASNSILMQNAGGAKVYFDKFYIYNNLFINPSLNGILMEGTGGKTYIYNNVFYGPTLNGQPSLEIQGMNGEQSFAEIKNNIFYSNGARELELYNGQSSSNVVLSNNVFYQATSSMGTGTNAITGNPLFVSVANKNFHLQSTSPAINAGVDVGITTDRDGVSRVGAPDIGAYEYH